MENEEWLVGWRHISFVLATPIFYQIIITGHTKCTPDHALAIPTLETFLHRCLSEISLKCGDSAKYILHGRPAKIGLPGLPTPAVSTPAVSTLLRPYEMYIDGGKEWGREFFTVTAIFRPNIRV